MTKYYRFVLRIDLLLSPFLLIYTVAVGVCIEMFVGSRFFCNYTTVLSLVVGVGFQIFEIKASNDECGRNQCNQSIVIKEYDDSLTTRRLTENLVKSRRD